jgi:hypothetical protein
MNTRLAQKIAFSAAAVLLLWLRRTYPAALSSDAVSAGLLILAFLPWVSSLVKAAELPGGWKIEFFDLKDQVAQQQTLVNDLVQYSMSASIFHHLCGVAILRVYKYLDNEGNRREFYFLRDNGLIRPKDARGFLDFGPALNGANLVDIAEVTPIGRMAVKLRSSDIPSNMVSDVQNLRVSAKDL